MKVADFQDTAVLLCRLRCPHGLRLSQIACVAWYARIHKQHFAVAKVAVAAEKQVVSLVVG